MAKQPKPANITEDQKAAAAAEAASGPETPATGNGGAVEAEVAAAAVPSAEAAAQTQESGVPVNAEADSQPPDSPIGPPLLMVKGPAKGRWRAGRFFGPEWAAVNPADLTRAQIEGLVADPELTVVPKD